MNEITLTLPWPPSANVYWRSDRGYVHVSAEAKAYKNEVGWMCREQEVEMFNGPIEIIIHAYMPSSRGDLGNVEKVTSDSLQGYCYENDVQLHHIELFRHEASKPKRKNAKVIVTIRPYQGLLK
jgi:Holliday junction resolvase RusA-like endonuclease